MGQMPQRRMPMMSGGGVDSNNEGRMPNGSGRPSAYRFGPGGNIVSSSNQQQLPYRNGAPMGSGFGRHQEEDSRRPLTARSGAGGERERSLRTAGNGGGF